MKYVLSHATALWVLATLADAGGRTSIPPASELATLDEASCSIGTDGRDVEGLRARLLELLGMRELPRRIDVLVDSSSKRLRSRHLAPHCWSGKVSSGSLVSLGDGLWASSPEFCFLQLAGELPLVDLILLGYCLCGKYFPSCTEKGFVATGGITTIERMQAFLDAQEPGAYGLRKAQKALRWVLDNSWSPMESRSALVMILSRSLGGYGLERPVLNQVVWLSEGAAAIASCPYYVIDIYWEKAHWAMEYDGPEFHKRLMRDIQRDLALMHDGITLQHATATQIRDERQLSEMVRQLSKRLGKRLRRPPKGTAAKRHRLMKGLFPEVAFLPDGKVAFEKPMWALPGECLACEREERRGWWLAA